MTPEQVIEALRQGACLIDRVGYDGKRKLIPALSHRIAEALELGVRARFHQRTDQEADDGL